VSVFGEEGGREGRHTVKLTVSNERKCSVGKKKRGEREGLLEVVS
jgi:hypothetical protein